MVPWRAAIQAWRPGPLWPRHNPPVPAAINISSPAPFSANSVISVCRVSCSRPLTDARSRTFVQAVFRVEMGRDGSSWCNFPKGKRYHCGSILPNVSVNHWRCSCRASYRGELKGIVRPSPASVFERPTTRNRFAKSICSHLSAATPHQSAFEFAARWEGGGEQRRWGHGDASIACKSRCRVWVVHLLLGKGGSGWVGSESRSSPAGPALGGPVRRPRR